MPVSPEESPPRGMAGSTASRNCCLITSISLPCASPDRHLRHPSSTRSSGFGENRSGSSAISLRSALSCAEAAVIWKKSESTKGRLWNRTPGKVCPSMYSGQTM